MVDVTKPLQKNEASETSSHQSRAMSRHRSGAMVERHEVMMSIDHIWWTLRVLTSKNIQQKLFEKGC